MIFVSRNIRPKAQMTFTGLCQLAESGQIARP